jgi:hypothetical protein
MVKDHTGTRFGRLVVLKQEESRGGKRRWFCVCDCGNTTTVSACSLTMAKTTSCGCRKKEAARENCKKHGMKPTHGLTNTKIHRTWLSIRARVKPEYKDAKNYYYRGIYLCERWEKFENFLEDMGHPPAGASIDRIEVNGPYSPENCRWATAKMQQNNKTNTRYLCMDGKKISLMNFANSFGIKKNAAQSFFSVLKIIKQSGSAVEIWSDHGLA